MENIIIRGVEYKTDQGILHVMYEVANDNTLERGFLPDYDLTRIEEHFNTENKDEDVWRDEVSMLMLDSEDYQFKRLHDGFIIHRSH